jgi:glycosyltransferase involved in cell wall biosynthesis
MRIGVNLFDLYPKHAGGMEIYVHNLLHALGRLEPDSEFVLVTAQFNQRAIRAKHPDCQQVVYDGADAAADQFLTSTADDRPQKTTLLTEIQRTLRRVRAWPLPLWRDSLSERIQAAGIDLWLCPLWYSLPFDVPLPTAVIIPDMLHTVYPNTLSQKDLSRRLIGVPYTLSKANVIITISDFVAKSIQDRYDIPADRIFVTPLGVDPNMQHASRFGISIFRRFLPRLGIEKPFIYYPANGWPHKNHEYLLRALQLLVRQGHDLQLALTGQTFGLMKRIEPLLHQLDLKGRVVHLGHVESWMVAYLYRTCQLVVVPSLYEGFGMPALEAMSNGATVACSARASLPEIVGDCALLFDPTSPKEICSQITRLLTDRALSKDLRACGKEQVKRFGFDRTAMLTRDAFRMAMAMHREGRPGTPGFRPLGLDGLIPAEGACITLDVGPGDMLRVIAKGVQDLQIRLDGESVPHTTEASAARRVAEVLIEKPGRIHWLELLNPHPANRKSRFSCARLYKIEITEQSGRRIALDWAHLQDD